MAFDGVTVAALVKELSEALVGARISKITQTEGDELYITLKPVGERKQTRLMLSASAALPLVYLTDSNKPGPMEAPAFCMLLRKHLTGGRIVSVEQPDFERVIRFSVSGLNEMGDVRVHVLVIELMGKHSNIILLDDNERVVDSIRRVPATVSSVREVLPGRDYFVPGQDKLSPLDADRVSLKLSLRGKGVPLYKAIYSSYRGLSPVISQELCHRAGIDGDRSAIAVTDEEFDRLCEVFLDMTDRLRLGEFSPETVLENGEPVEYAAFPLTLYHSDKGALIKSYSSMSAMLEEFYRRKNTAQRMRQRSADLRRVVTGALERDRKKLELQKKQLRDTEKREKYRLCGELLQIYGYQVPKGANKFTAEDYHTGKPVEITLDPTLTAQENAVKYFDRYGKLKRTEEALTEQTARTEEEIEHLESIEEELSRAASEAELKEIRQELSEAGFVKKTAQKRGGARKEEKSEPLHYRTEDGFDIYVGRNNLQNDRLTFHFATGGDWWFHVKKLHGSHVILKSDGGREIPDRVYEQAAALAAWHSAGREQSVAEVDYIRKKELKKPPGARPGYVIYHTNYSMAIRPGTEGLELIG